MLIVARNQAELTRRTLTSLLSPAPGADTEVIVVDNASNDGGAALDGDFPAVKMLRMQRNFGWTRAVNVGTRTAQGEFLCLTPPGIEFLPETLPALIAALGAHPEASAVAPLTLDRQGTVVSRAYPLPDRDTFARFWKTGQLGRPQPIDRTAAAIPVEFLTGSPILLRRQSIVAMNYLDLRYGHFWADAEIAHQIRRAGKRLLLLAGIAVQGVPYFQPIPERLDDTGARLSADAALGAAAYLGKYSGFAAGSGFHVAAVVQSFFSIFTFQQLGPRISRCFRILTGQKIDGTEPG